MFITSTIVNSLSAFPPATIRPDPVQSAMELHHSVGMGGNSSIHFLPSSSPVRLNSWLVRVPLCFPPTNVSRLLTMPYFHVACDTI